MPRPPLRKWVRDAGNVARYGRAAMLSDETLYVNPELVTLNFKSPHAEGSMFDRQSSSGTVLAGDWDRDAFNVTSWWKFKACVAHFQEGVPWSETPVYDRYLAQIAKYGVYDGCQNLSDVKARYSKIDRLYDQIARDGALREQKHLPSFTRGEFCGIFGHIDRHGAFMRFGEGNHRFAIARCLGLKKIPVHVGNIHQDAIRNGVIPQMRESQFDRMKTDA